MKYNFCGKEILYRSLVRRGQHQKSMEIGIFKSKLETHISSSYVHISNTSWMTERIDQNWG